MDIINSDIEKVAVYENQYPPADLPEIAFAGRSNVGKSSLLNLLTGRKKLARVSSSPGKTRTINFYRINDEFRIVDLPGYGYAKLSKKEQEKWGMMLEHYIETRKNLVSVVQLVDIRHKPSLQDVQMFDYISYYGLDRIVVATKADKLSKNKQQQNIKIIKKTLDMRPGDVVVPVSSLKRQGHDILLDEIDKLLKEK